MDAKRNAPKIDWEKFEPVKPSFTGNKLFENYSLSELRKYIDWTPFFSTWMLKGKHPAILEDKVVGLEAKKLLDDANQMLDRIIGEDLLEAKAVVGFYPVNRIGDDISVLSNEKDGHLLTELHFLRQQGKKSGVVPNYSLSDFLAPEEYGIDYLGFFAVTTGIGIEELISEFEANHDDYSSIMVKAVADRLAEAFAERMHEKVRKELWGYAADEAYSSDDLIKEKYVGIRPAPGYPACPDHTEKKKIWELLNVEDLTGIKLTESFAMFPASSVSGYYFSHPESRYFPIGKIGKDQVEDYAKRKGMSITEVENWLASNLNYDK